MIRLAGLLIFLCLSGAVVAATVQGSAGGFADSTPGFWEIGFLSGNPGESISTVTLQMPGPGYFDLDGVDNYANQVVPVVNMAGISGVTASDVAFSFVGMQPTQLDIIFAPGSFAVGDRLQFAASIDGMGSELGGAVGAFGGTTMTVTLFDGRTGSGQIVTNTSLTSVGTVQIPDSQIPEPGTFSFILAGFAIAATAKSKIT